MPHASWNPYPISDQNLWFSLLCFRLDQNFDTLFQTFIDEEVANSSKTPTQFKTRVHKPYPISDQNGYKKRTLWHGTYLYSLYKGLLPGTKNALQIMSLAAYESETNADTYLVSNL